MIHLILIVAKRQVLTWARTCGPSNWLRYVRKHNEKLFTQSLSIFRCLVPVRLSPSPWIDGQLMWLIRNDRPELTTWLDMIDRGEILKLGNWATFPYIAANLEHEYLRLKVCSNLSNTPKPVRTSGFFESCVSHTKTGEKKNRMLSKAWL